MIIKEILPSPWLVSSISFLCTFLSFIPSFLSQFERDSYLNDMKPFIDSTWTVHSSLGALGCCIPLLLIEFFHPSFIKREYFSSRTSQRICLLSIVIPATVIYATSMTETLSPGNSYCPPRLPDCPYVCSVLVVLYLCSTNSQEILYFGGFLIAYFSSSKSDCMKFLALCSYLLFTIGFLFSSFRLPNAFSFYLIFLGFFGFATLSLGQIWMNSIPSPDATSTLQPPKDNSFHILVLVNLVFRAVLYSLVRLVGVSLRPAEILPYLLIANTLTTVVIFTISSVRLMDELFLTKLRFESKRNFIRYISQ
jgi:hypothetical protein